MIHKGKKNAMVHFQSSFGEAALHIQIHVSGSVEADQKVCVVLSPYSTTPESFCMAWSSSWCKQEWEIALGMLFIYLFIYLFIKIYLYWVAQSAKAVLTWGPVTPQYTDIQ